MDKMHAHAQMSASGTDSFLASDLRSESERADTLKEGLGSGVRRESEVRSCQLRAWIQTRAQWPRSPRVHREEDQRQLSQHSETKSNRP